MRVRGTAVALALLLLATSVPAATRMCCPAGRAAQTSIRSMDCCEAALLRCPASLQAIVSADSSDDSLTVRIEASSAVPGGSHDSPPLLLQGSLGERVSRTTSFSHPPLFRLYSQLLI